MSVPWSYMGVIPITSRCESVTYQLGLFVTYQPDCSMDELATLWTSFSHEWPAWALDEVAGEWDE